MPRPAQCESNRRVAVETHTTICARLKLRKIQR